MNVQKLVDFVQGRSISIDSRQIQPNQVFIALKGERFDAHDFLDQVCQQVGCAAIVDHKVELPIPTLVVDDTLVALQHIAAAHRARFDVFTVAVTGSCGKTTTRGLLESVFGQAGPTLASVGSFNNHIGVPLTLLRLNDSYRYFIAEIGANHMGEIAHLVPLVRPQIAIITNVGPAHLEGFGSLENTARGKSEIYGGLPDDGIAVVNADDAFADVFHSVNQNRSLVTFGIEHDADVMADNIELDALGRPRFDLVVSGVRQMVQLQLLGKHNVANALAAAAAGFAAGLTVQQICDGLASAPAEKKRMNAVCMPQGGRLIDDSYNANPLSTSAAIHYLAHQPGERVLVLADMKELGEDGERMHAEIGALAKQSDIKHLFGYGELAQAAVEAFGEGGQHFFDKAVLVDALQSMITADHVVLVKGSNSMHMNEVVEALTQLPTTP